MKGSDSTRPAAGPGSTLISGGWRTSPAAAQDGGLGGVAGGRPVDGDHLGLEQGRVQEDRRPARPGRRTPADDGQPPQPPPGPAALDCSRRWRIRGSMRPSSSGPAHGAPVPVRVSRPRSSASVPMSAPSTRSSKPTRRTSVSSSTPVSAPPRPARASMTRTHVVGRAAPVGLDEVGVLGRDLGACPMRRPFRPHGVDQPPGRVAGRVGEDRAGVGPAGLVGPPPAHDLGDGGSPGSSGSPGASR